MVKVLVIEDEIEIRANLLELLALEGYDIVGADNGVTGLIGAMEHEPDLILCDVMMPELDGHDVLSALRQEPETASIPFIFLTALADKGDIRQGMALGADDYLTKPFTCMEVIKAIETRLQKQAAIAEQYKTDSQEFEALQQENQQFRDALDQDQAALISDIRSHMKNTLNQLNQVSSLLKTLPTSKEREQGIALIQKTCVAKIKMLARIPNFEHLPEADSPQRLEASRLDELVLTDEADELTASFF